MAVEHKSAAVIANDILVAALSSPLNLLQLGGGPDESAAAIAAAFQTIFEAVKEKNDL